MKATFSINATLMQRLREESARRGKTMSALVEAGILRILERDAAKRATSEPLPPLPTWHGGKPLVDIANRDALDEAMDED